MSVTSDEQTAAPSGGKPRSALDLPALRARLASQTGQQYWRSLEELADTPDFRGFVEREFPSQASEFTDPAGRREFLKLMAASLALAGVPASQAAMASTACSRISACAPGGKPPSS